MSEWGVEAALLMGACLPLAWMTNHPEAPPGPLVITGGRQELPDQPPDSWNSGSSPQTSSTQAS